MGGGVGVAHDVGWPVAAQSGCVTSYTMHIDLDVRMDGDQIAGQAGDGVGQPTPFHGWLGLLGVLDRLMGTAGPAGGPACHLTPGPDPGAGHAG